MKHLWMWVLLLGWTLPLMAQEPAPNKTPEERAALKVKRLTERYDLSADQQARLEPELLKSEKVIANKREYAREAHTEIAAARAEQEAAVAAVLTPEQKKKFEQDMAALKAKKRERRKQGMQRHQPEVD